MNSTKKIYRMKIENKPYSCTECGRSFSQERYLKQHTQRKNTCTIKFSCTKCGKEFANASNLKIHENRSTSCIVEEIPVISTNNTENKCHICGNTYSTPSSLKRHQREVCSKDKSKIDQLISLVMELKEENKMLRQQNPATPVTNNITNNIQNNLYMNVTFCNFGSEDLSKLDPEKVMQLLRGQVKDFMSKMIEYIHAGPDHPEYHNVFYDPERKKAIVLVRISDTEMSWQTRDFREVSDILTDRLRDHVAPGNGPYFDMAMKDKDYDTSNNIINIAKHINWKTDESVEMNQASLTTLAKNQSFMDQVRVQELTSAE